MPHAHKHTCITDNLGAGSLLHMSGQNICLMYVNERVSHSEYGNLETAVQRLIPFSVHTCSNLIEKHLEKQAGSAI